MPAHGPAIVIAISVRYLDTDRQVQERLMQVAGVLV